MSEAIGEIEKEGRVLVVRRIHVTYHLRLPSDKREAAERALSVHADACPMARSIKNCIEIRTDLEMEPLDEGEI